MWMIPSHCICLVCCHQHDLTFLSGNWFHRQTLNTLQLVYSYVPIPALLLKIETETRPSPRNQASGRDAPEPERCCEPTHYLQKLMDLPEMTLNDSPSNVENHVAIITLKYSWGRYRGGREHPVRLWTYDLKIPETYKNVTTDFVHKISSQPDWL